MFNFIAVLFLVAAPVVTIACAWCAAHGDGWVRESWCGIAATLSLVLSNIIWQCDLVSVMDSSTLGRIAGAQYILAAVFVSNWLFQSHRAA